MDKFSEKQQMKIFAPVDLTNEILIELKYNFKDVKLFGVTSIKYWKFKFKGGHQRRMKSCYSSDFQVENLGMFTLFVNLKKIASVLLLQLSVWHRSCVAKLTDQNQSQCLWTRSHSSTCIFFLSPFMKQCKTA